MLRHADLVVLRDGLRSFAVGQALVLAKLSTPIFFFWCIVADGARERSEGAAACHTRREMRKRAHVVEGLHLAPHLVAVLKHVVVSRDGARRIGVLLLGAFAAKAPNRVRGLAHTIHSLRALHVRARDWTRRRRDSISIDRLGRDQLVVGRHGHVEVLPQRDGLVAALVLR
eukprot:6213279-Pleurochrysis_carterae.AAC.1